MNLSYRRSGTFWSIPVHRNKFTDRWWQEVSPHIVKENQILWKIGQIAFYDPSIYVGSPVSIPRESSPIIFARSKTFESRPFSLSMMEASDFSGGAFNCTAGVETAGSWKAATCKPCANYASESTLRSLSRTIPHLQ